MGDRKKQTDVKRDNRKKINNSKKTKDILMLIFDTENSQQIFDCENNGNHKF